MRRAKVDANQPAIVEALRRVGAVWVPTYRHGDGTPDGWVLFRRVWTPMEIKMPGEGLTDDEKIVHAACAAAGYSIPTPHTVDEALRGIGAVVS